MPKGFVGGFVTLSFDDGWRSVYETALPLLEEKGFKSTHYIISGCLDDAQFPRYMNLQHLRDLEEQGHEIGCHTASHKHLLEETESIIREEVLLSVKFLRDFGLSVETFAYPYGEYDERVITTVKKGNFRGARSIEKGYNDEHTEPFVLKCQAVMVDTPLSGVEDWLKEAKHSNTWLILMFHQIDTEGRPWSTTPAGLKQILDSIDIPVISVREGLSRMNH